MPQQKSLVDKQSTFTIIDVISDKLVEMLATAKYPRLAPLPNGKAGRIIVGEPGQFQEIVPPRIIFRPLKSDFLPPDMSLGVCTLAGDASENAAERKERISALKHRAIWTEEVTFEVWCSSLAPTGSFVDQPDIHDAWRVDYEYTRFLFHNLIAAMHFVMPGGYGLGGGTWISRKHLERIMREFVFRVEFRLPILSEPIFTAATTALAGFETAPEGTAAEVTDQFIINPGPGGSDAYGIQPVQPTRPAMQPSQAEATAAAAVDPGTAKVGPGCEE